MPNGKALHCDLCFTEIDSRNFHAPESGAILCPRNSRPFGVVTKLPHNTKPPLSASGGFVCHVVRGKSRQTIYAFLFWKHWLQ